MQANSMELDNIARTTRLDGDVKTQLAPPAQR
jgi:hypothetical protein